MTVHMYRVFIWAKCLFFFQATATLSRKIVRKRGASSCTMCMRGVCERVCV